MAIVVLASLMRILAGDAMDFGNGEAYYVASSRVLDWSWFDQPPIFLWLLHFWIGLLGDTTPWLVRLPFIAQFALTSALLFVFTAKLFSPKAGLWAVLFLNVSGVFTLSIASWPQPDGPLMLFWMATAVLLLPVIQGKPNADRLGLWLAAGVCLGLAMLSKYHAAFLPLGLLLFLLTTPGRARLLASPGPWLATGVALVIFTPVLIWNAQNEWASFLFQGGRAGGTGLHPEWLLRMILGQMLWILPWLWLPMIWVLVKVMRRGPWAAHGFDPGAWFCALTALGPILVFTVVSLWASLGFHFHWQAPGYLMLFPLLGAATAGWLAAEDKPKLRKRVKLWLAGSTIATVGAITLLVAQMGYSLFTPLLPEGVPDPTLEAAPWSDLAPLLDEPPFSEVGIVASVHWVQCGKADAALGNRHPVLCLTDDPRNLAFTRPPAAYEGADALLVGTAKRLNHPIAFMDQSFSSLEPGPTVTLHRNGVPAYDVETRLGRGFTTRRDFRLDGSAPQSLFGFGFSPEAEAMAPPSPGADGQIGQGFPGDKRTVPLYLLVEGRGTAQTVTLDLLAAPEATQTTEAIVTWTGHTMSTILWENVPLGRIALAPGTASALRVTLPPKPRPVGRMLYRFNVTVGDDVDLTARPLVARIRLD